MKVLVTGGNGFLGRAIIRRLIFDQLHTTLVSVRKPPASHFHKYVDVFYSGDVDADTDWFAALSGVDVIIHTVARVPLEQGDSRDSVGEFSSTNTDGTLNLARQAEVAGVKRFLFISSISVLGTISIEPFSEENVPNPVGPYAISKLKAENGLRNLATETGMDVTIIRPPLVYGFNAPGKFGQLINAVARGIPLPLGAIRNKRSFVFVDNLTDLIVTCIDHPKAANQIFLAGDGEDLSTTQLLRKIAHLMGKPARLIPIPASVLTLTALLLGKKSVAQSLCGSLQTDISKARNVLGWEPPVSVNEGFRIAVHGDRQV